MELKQAISLIEHPTILINEQSSWADLGCGSGLFTIALAHLLIHGSKIFAVDKNREALYQLPYQNHVTIKKLQVDFIDEELFLDNLNGILMANSFHYVKDKVLFINKVSKYLQPKGFFLIVEYNTDQPNPWIPFPVSYTSLKALFQKMGYYFMEKIKELPSKYNRSKIYAAVITK